VGSRCSRDTNQVHGSEPGIHEGHCNADSGVESAHLEERRADRPHGLADPAMSRQI
jgi:hypothetical protein